MAQIPTYQKALFQLGGKPQINPIDTSFLNQIGQGIQARADEKASEEGYQAGIAAQRGQAALQRQEGGLFENPYEVEAFNKGAQVQFGIQKESELDRKVMELQAQYEFDPAGFRQAVVDFETEFFTGIPSEVLPGFSSYFDEKTLKAEGQVKANLIKRERDQQRADTLAGIDTKLTRIESSILAGQGGDEDVARFGVLVDAAVQAGNITALEGVKYAKDAALIAKRAEAVLRLRRGENLEQIIADVHDPKGTFSGLDLDQQDAVIAQVSQEWNQLRSRMVGTRAALDQRIKAMERLALRGEDVDLSRVADQMIGAGYEAYQIERTLTSLNEAQRLGRDVRAFTQRTLTDQHQLASEARRAAQGYSGDDPVEEDRLWKRADLFADAYGKSASAYIDDPWKAYQGQDPDSYLRLDLTTESGLDQALSVIRAQSGNPNPSILPKSMLDGMNLAWNGLTTTEQKFAFVADIQNRYGKHARQVMEEMELDAASRLAMDALAVGDTNSASELILAGQNAEAAEKLLRTDDKGTIEENAATRFPATMFAGDSEVALEYQTTFKSLTANLMARGLALEAAQTRAEQIMLRGKDPVELNGTTMLAPIGTNAEGINLSLDVIAEDPSALSLRIGTGQSDYTVTELGDLLRDETRTTLVPMRGGYAVADRQSGELIYQETRTGKAPLIIESNGAIRGAQTAPSFEQYWSGAALGIRPEQVPAEKQKYVGRRVTSYLGEETESVDATAQRAFLEAQRLGLAEDQFARQITRIVPIQDRLVGVSAAIKNGSIPDWALDVLKEVPEFSALDQDGVRERVIKAWADVDKRKGTPLQVLYGLVRKAERLQPVPSLDDTGGYVTGQYSPIKTILGERERSNDYNIVNRMGYAGKYQFGAMALADLGLIKPARLEGRSNLDVMNDPKAWTIRGGLEAFRADPALQEKTMDRWMALLTKRLTKRGIINDQMPEADRNGYIAVAHLLGVGGAAKFKRGINGTDGFGTTAQSYFDLGRQRALA